jgi:hypothetical protein
MARIWVEHLRGVMPDSSFRAYGDVLAVKAEEVDMNGERSWHCLHKLTQLLTWSK